MIIVLFIVCTAQIMYVQTRGYATPDNVERVRAREDGRYESNICKAGSQKSIFLLTIHYASLQRLLQSEKWEFSRRTYDELSKYYFQKIFSLTTTSGETRLLETIGNWELSMCIP